MNLKCSGCGRAYRHIPLPPLHCGCGAVTDEYGVLVQPTTHKAKDVVKSKVKPIRSLERLVRERAGCGLIQLDPLDGLAGRIAKQLKVTEQQAQTYIDDARKLYDKQFKYPEIAKRNLIYHIYPADGWEPVVEELAQHLSIFNGKRVVAVAGGSPSVIAKVRKLLRYPDRILSIKNDPILREQVTFRPLLDNVLNNRPNEATFYAHTKALTTADSVDGATLWRKVMVRNLLGRWEEAMLRLRSHTFVGTHKMLWPEDQPVPFPTGLRPRHQWMHAGTFWWFRHDRVSELDWPGAVVKDRYGVEAWPAQLVPHKEAFSMWQPWVEDESAWPQRNPYDPGLYYDAGVFE